MPLYPEQQDYIGIKDIGIQTEKHELEVLVHNTEQIFFSM